MRVSLKHKIFAGSGIAILVLGALSWVSYRSSAATLESARWVSHTRDVLEHLDSLVAHLADADAAYQDYLQSGDARSLTAVDSAFRQSPRLIARVRALTADDPAQQRRLDNLAPLVVQRLAWTQQLIDTKRTRGPQAVRQLLRSGAAERILPAIGRVVGEIRSSEESLLAERTATLERVARRTQTWILAGTGVALLLALLGIRQLSGDLTARQGAEQALKDSEQRFRALTDDVKDYAIFWIDPSGRIASWNVGAERLNGYRPEEILGQSISVLYTPEDVARGKPEAELRIAAAEGRVEDEGWRLRRDGTRFWANAVVTAVRNRDGTLLGFAKITRDITERKRGEEALQQYAAQLEAANAELDAFAYSVSHDLRAPLRSIDGFSQALLEDYGDRLDQSAREHLDRVRAASQRMAGLIDHLLGLSRVTRAELHQQTVDLSAMAQDVLAELRRREPERRAEFVVQPGVTTTGDSHLLRVVLENLLGNAWKYTRYRPHTRIEFGVTERDGVPAYYVRDNGAGFDMAHAGKLFGAFQRLHTEAEFEGTGIGLATVQRIVQRHGGRVWAESTVGQGASFYFTL